MNVWSYAAPLRQIFSVLDFFTVYFVTLLGRCAVLSLPVLGLILFLRKIAWKQSAFLRGTLWITLLPVLFLGKLGIYYESRAFLPFILWQSLCSGYWWVRYGYLAGVGISVALLFHRRGKLQRLLRGLPSEEIDGQRAYLCDAVISPFTAGTLSPKIVIPKIAWEQFDENDLQTILLHERTHIRLGHLWCFLLWDVFCALFWINPFLRLSTPKLKADMEHICDRVTIRRSGRDAVSYGYVLLKSMTLLRAETAGLPVTFAGETDFSDVKQRLCRVRDYRPYLRRNIVLLCLCTAGLLLTAFHAIHQMSLPRYTELNGFTVYHVDQDILFTTVYETNEDEFPPINLNGNRAEVDNRAFCELLSEDIRKDGLYYILWGGFLKLPGIGGAMNAVYIDGISDGATTAVEFHNTDELFYVKLAKWV